MSGESGNETEADLAALAGLQAADVDPIRREAIRSRCHARLRSGAPVRRAWVRTQRKLEPAAAAAVVVLYLLAVLDRAVVVLAR